MNFPLRTAFTVSHRLWIAVSLFLFVSGKFLISSLISFLTHSLFNSMLLNKDWGKDKIREEIKNFPETNDNEPKTTQKLWDTAKAVLRGKFLAIQAYLKKIKTVQTNNLTLRLQELEEQQQRQPRACLLYTSDAADD